MASAKYNTDNGNISTIIGIANTLQSLDPVTLEMHSKEIAKAEKCLSTLFENIYGYSYSEFLLKFYSEPSTGGYYSASKRRIYRKKF